MSSASPNSLHPSTPKHILALLDHLHAESQAQESAISPQDLQTRDFDELMCDKFIALDQDKSQFLYQICRAINAKTVVEAGTSYGVSTIYLALAVSENASTTGGTGRIIATENEPDKARRARGYWDECGEVVSGVIDLREGDLRETLKEGVDGVDLLLLDSELPVCFTRHVVY
jgi:predicted O-methyltransferase YrrM